MLNLWLNPWSVWTVLKENSLVILLQGKLKEFFKKPKFPINIYYDTDIKNTVNKNMEETNFNLGMLKESIAGKIFRNPNTKNWELQLNIFFCLTAATDDILTETVNKLDKMGDFDFQSNQFQTKLTFF